MHFRKLAQILLFGSVISSMPCWAIAQPGQEQDELTVGVQPDGRILVPTNQMLHPAGKQITFSGRPVDLAFAESGKIIVVKNRVDLLFVDAAKGVIKQTLPLRGKKEERKLGFGVVGLVVHGDYVYAGDNQNQVRVAKRQANGSYQWEDGFALTLPKVGGFADPAGLALQDERTLWVASTRGNNVQRIDLKSGKVEEVVPVGVAPYAICCWSAERCYVSNWGGDLPKNGDPQAKSSDTPIRIDPKSGVANQGTVSVLTKMDGQWKQTGTIPVGLHPCGMVLSKAKQRLYVANANSDTVSVIDTAKNEVVETIACRPEASLPFGSGSNALALSPDGGTLYVANGTNNCVAVVQLGVAALDPNHKASAEAQSKVAGLLPTGWYPGAILVSRDGKKLTISNIKGHGSLSQSRPAARGKATRDYLGSISLIDVPDSAQLSRFTQEVNANNRLSYSLAGLGKPSASAAPIAVPKQHGEPSMFKHVFYIIKENRTYDQVFGDMKEGNGDPNLVMFGEEVTPNHHALAREFTLFDNFYCSGVLSADGHSWVNEAYVTDYLERAFGGFTRSYPDEGSDPLAYPATGFLWNNALAHGKTFRNYGEFVNDKYAPPGTSWSSIYKDVKNKTHNVKINVRPNIKSLEPYTHPRYPWFPLLAPDQYRADVFLEEFQEFEKKGELPNLIYITLPCDHTQGTRPGFPTPRAMVADNDLALGRIVEAITKSQFWPRSCIFVVEDDPQDGFDHVDAHRTVALVISPFTKRQFVDHTNYNQTGMVKTIELMLRLPPMTQFDLSATPMRNCFRASPVVDSYTCLPNRVRLDEMNPAVEKLQGKALHWARQSLALNLDEGDAANEDTLNRILWHATRGYDRPYPERFAGRNTEEEEGGKDDEKR